MNLADKYGFKLDDLDKNLVYEFHIRCQEYQVVPANDELWFIAVEFNESDVLKNVPRLAVQRVDNPTYKDVKLLTLNTQY